jgi:hypothetical protein
LTGRVLSGCSPTPPLSGVPPGGGIEQPQTPPRLRKSYSYVKVVMDMSNRKHSINQDIVVEDPVEKQNPGQVFCDIDPVHPGIWTNRENGIIIKAYILSSESHLEFIKNWLN